MFSHWRWKVSAAVALAALGLVAGTLLAGGAWLISLLGLRFIFALAGVGAFLGWGWSFGKAAIPPAPRRIVRIARRQSRPAGFGFVRCRTRLPDSIQRRMEMPGCRPF